MLLLATLTLGEPFVIDNQTESLQRPSTEVTTAPFVTWKRRLPQSRLGARSQSQLSAPTINDDLLYVGSAFSDSLHVLEPANGSEVRSYQAHSAVQSEPIFVGDSIVFCDEGGYTFSYETTSDTPTWEHFGGAPITSQPSLVGENVIISSVDDSVYSINAETGMVAWRHTQPPSLIRETELTLYGAPSPVSWSDSIISGFSDGSIVALSADTGTVQWQKQVGEGIYPDIIATPIIDGDNIYTGGFEGPFVALVPQTQSIRWSLNIGTTSQPAYDNSIIYHAGSDGVLRKIDSITGQVIWQWDADIEGSLTTPRLTQAGIITSSTEETIYLIDNSSGEEIWRFHDDVQLSGMSSPITVGGQGFYGVTNKGMLLSFDTIQTEAPTDNTPN